MKIDILKEISDLSRPTLGNSIAKGLVFIPNTPINSDQVANKYFVDSRFTSKENLSSFELSVNLKLKKSLIGQSKGLVPLDSNAKIPLKHIPSYLQTVTIEQTDGLLITTDPNPPAGYLRANGAYVRKSEYPELFDKLKLPAIVSVSSNKGYGHPWKYQDHLYGDHDVNIGTFTNTGKTLPVSGWAFSNIVVTKNYVYTFAGALNSTTTTDKVYRAPINDDGTIGDFIEDTSVTIPADEGLGYARYAITHKGKVYLFGGFKSPYYNRSVVEATINSDGTLSNFTTPPTLAPNAAGQAFGEFIKIEDTVHLIGGIHSGGSFTIMYSKSLYDLENYQDFVRSSVGYVSDKGVDRIKLVFTKNRVYRVGGQSNGTVLDEIWYAPIDGNGEIGQWVDSGMTLPVPLSGHQVIQLGKSIYIVGGWTGSSLNTTIYKATVNTDGTISAFTPYGDPLPQGSYGLQAFVTKGHLYILGGATSPDLSTGVNTIYVADLTADSADITIGFNDYTGYSGTTTEISKYETDFYNVESSRYEAYGSPAPGTNLNFVTNFDGNLSNVKHFPSGLNYHCEESVAFVTKNKVYIFGYINTSLYNRFLRADITENGELVNVRLHDLTLPYRVSGASIAVIKDRFYLFGGDDGNGYHDRIITGTIDEDGEITSITQDTRTLPRPLYQSRCIVTYNNVYIIGGAETPDLYSNEVYRAPVNYDGTIGDFTLDTYLQMGMARGIVMTYNNRVYYIGGASGNNTSNIVFRATIQSDGFISTFQNLGPIFPYHVKNAASIVIGRYGYIFGGITYSGNDTRVSKITFNDDGTFSVQANAYTLPSNNIESCSIAAGNKVYVLGGVNSATGLTDGSKDIYTFDIDISLPTDYMSFINGHVNRFDGSYNTSGYIRLLENNPDPNIYFKLPDTTQLSLENGLYGYIKY